MPVDADSLGSYLRQERERRQVSLQDIASATKIQLKFLEALENDAYDQLPAAPFVVGFLRAYAQYIALDPEKILAAYRSLQHAPAPVEEGGTPVGTPEPSRPRLVLVRLGAFAVVLGLGLGLVVYAFRRDRAVQPSTASFPVPPQATLDTSPKPVLPPSPSLPRAEAPAPLPAPVTSPAPVTPAPRHEPGVPVAGGAGTEAVPPVSTPTHAVPTSAVPTSAVSLVPPTSQGGPPAESSSPLVLQAKALEDTWLRIEIDGKKQLSLLLTSGKSIQWEASERFRLTIGNVRGIRLALNGQDIPLQAGRSNVVRDFLLTRSSLQ